MTRLHIDIETFSPESLNDVGLYKYAMHPEFRILLVAYAWEDDPVDIFDLGDREELPEWFIYALTDRGVVKCAHNAAFERVCLTMLLRRLGVLGPDDWLDPLQWHCTMVQSSRCGLPASLADVGKALGLEQQKMTEGKALIRKFCTPRPKTKGLFGDGSGRVLPEDCPEDWELFKSYCVRDVEVEQEIDKATSWLPVSDFERRLWAADQHINDRGVLLDMDLVRSAVRAEAVLGARLNEEALKVSGLSNPNSVSQLKAWIAQRTGTYYDTLSKTVIGDLLKTSDDEVLKSVLRIRLGTGKASVAKYRTMLDVAAPDNRARGLTQFYGSRTGRWAGRLIQMQNLPQNHIEALDAARAMLLKGDLDAIELNFGSVSDTLSQLIRTAFVAPEGQVLAVCDFSAIEARVLAWLAGEDWVLDTFREGRDIYCETASRMFHVPVEKHGRNAELRQKGKIAVLALGYQGGKGALDAMGGARLGMTEEQEADTVVKWREANPKIVNLWSRIEEAARRCCITGETCRVRTTFTTLVFAKRDDTMTVTLPSGRQLCYKGMQESFDEGKRKVSLSYLGVNQSTRSWERTPTFGGKLTENITQAIARDCLAEVMVRLEDADYPIVFHVHDEIVAEVLAWSADRDLKRIERAFAVSPDWAADLPLKGAGYLTPYYKKD